MFTVQILETTQVLQSKTKIHLFFSQDHDVAVSFDETEAEQIRPRDDGDQGHSPSGCIYPTYQPR